jgi:uncharacterized protein YndB with AHSA1/START domain
MSETIFTVKEDKKTLLVERVFNAPRTKVWAAWTTPEQFVKWWGPKGWTTKIKEKNFSEGGVLVYGMVCEDPNQTDWYGKTSWGKSTYTAIDAENSFTYIDEFCDENGTVDPAMPRMEIAMQFIDEDGATRVVSTSEFATPEALEQVIAMGMQAGLEQTWDRLAELVA